MHRRCLGNVPLPADGAGRRARAPRGSYGRQVAGGEPRTPAAPARPRPPRWDVVDHALARRRLLHDLRSGRVGEAEACDASPYLQRAAAEWGRRTTTPCPVCRRDPVWEIAWVYGDALGDGDGTARSARGVELLARARPEFTVYDVEVCQRCGWNHLLRTYRTGTAGTSPARRSRERTP